MAHRLQELLVELRQLEKEIAAELGRNTNGLRFERIGGKIRFDKDTIRRHKAMAVGLFRYLLRSSFLLALTSPFIYMMILPALFMDAFASVYQFICFPVYGIPKVARGDYIIIDHHKLRYLNSLEKANCVYCGYFNGLIGYIQEMAGRTEKHWCPIRHAVQGKSRHSQVHTFLEYGDAESYRDRFEDIRNRYEN
jgi:hypothetical protein